MAKHNESNELKRQYDEYNWQELYLTGGLDKLLVEDLNKYMYFNHHDIHKAHKLTSFRAVAQRE